jgi:hypothetical protein
MAVIDSELAMRNVNRTAKLERFEQGTQYAAGTFKSTNVQDALDELAGVTTGAGTGAISDSPMDGTTYGRNNGVWVHVLALSGGTMTGPLVTTSTLTLNADPAAALQAATKQYVDNTAVSVSGDTMTGLLVLSANPAAALGAATKQYVDAGIAAGIAAAIVPPRSYLSGLGMSTAGVSATFTVAAGTAADSTNVDMLTLASSLSKTTAAWVVGSGNGAWDGTGTNPASSAVWQHVYLIKRTDTGIVDVLISASATAPTMPPNYNERRRIGAMLTNASNQWMLFHQLGDEFLWDTPVNDVNTATIGTTTTAYTLTVPPGVQVNALARYTFNNSVTAGASVLVQSPDEASAAPGTPPGNASITNADATTSARMTLNVRTNTSAQIKATCAVAANNSFYITTYGWIDRRGRDA